MADGRIPKDTVVTQGRRQAPRRERGYRDRRLRDRRRPYFLEWMQWYDFVLLPLLLLAAILVLCNLPAVLLFFFKLNIYLIDIFFVIGGFLLLVLILIWYIGRRRY